MVRGNILIISQNQLYREGLKHLLLKARFTIGGEGRAPAEAIRTTTPSKPVDLAILALEPGSGTATGLAQIGLLRRDRPSAKLVVLAASLSPAEFLQAMRAGVDAILTGDISSGVLQASLELVLQSQQIFLAPLSHVMAQAAPSPDEAVADEPESSDKDEEQGAEERSNLVPFAPFRPNGRTGIPLAKPRLAPAPAAVAEPHVPVLSEREGQILHCLVKGFSNKAIARELEVAETTVKVHVKGLMRKVRAANRTQVAIWAMNHWAAPGDPAPDMDAALDLGRKIGVRPGVVVGMPDQSCSA